jgi:EmrB/QacA subfamily drug resistance transporter
MIRQLMASMLHDTTEAGRFTAIEERAILAVTCLAAFLFFNSFGSIGIALPLIQKQFGNSLAEIQWISLMGVVTISSLSFCFGRAGGIFGQRLLYKLGVALYAAGAGLGAVSTTFVQLLSARAVMAVGLAMALPMSTAILAASFESDRRGQVLGLFASAIAIGRMTGPAIGGLLLQFGDWSWIFWMNFIVGTAVTAAVIKIFRGPGQQRAEPFDVWGSITLLIGYPALLIGLTFGAKLGWTAAPVVTCFFIAVLGLASFVWIELNTSRPLIDVRLLKRKMLAAALAAVVLSHLIYNPIALCAPLYLQNVLSASAILAGLILAVLPLSTALASPLSGRLADRYDASTVSAIGLAIIVGGVACYSRLGTDSPFGLVAAVLFVLGVGIGFFTPANQKAAFATIEREDYGVLAAMLSSFGTAAGTIGTTITVALMEMDGGGELWMQPAAFAGAQRFAFACLVPIGVLALLITRKRYGLSSSSNAAQS